MCLCCSPNPNRGATPTLKIHSTDTLYAPIPGFDSFLINNCGEVVNQWTSEYRIGLSAYLLEDGSLLRTGQLSSGAIPAFSGGGTGGRVERFNWEGELVWHIDWADDTKHHHHDIEMLNGNIYLSLGKVIVTGGSFSRQKH